MYKLLIRPLVFLFNPETCHKFIVKLLKFNRKIPFGRALTRAIFKSRKKCLSKEVFGINFPNPVGLAGGFDKNGEIYNELSDLGFGFVEIGSLTPSPQDGNPKPRVFRSPKDRAIINRMGINNKGIRNAVEQIKNNKPEVIIAGNISKNSSSMNEAASKDYETGFALLYDFVDLFVINISCPNVVGLTDLQDINYLSDIIDKLIALRLYFDEYKPILLKISPDIPKDHLDDIISYCMISGIDGVVANNTTRGRSGLRLSEERIKEIGNGGLSGAPLYQKTLETVKYISQKTEGRLPIVASGGIMTPEQAEEILDAGASLIEIYSGMIYEGPGIVKKIVKHLENKHNQ